MEISIAKLMFHLLYFLWSGFTITVLLIQAGVFAGKGIDLVFYSLMGLTMTSIKNIQIALKESK